MFLQIYKIRTDRINSVFILMNSSGILAFCCLFIGVAVADERDVLELLGQWYFLLGSMLFT
jgi:hypothetical protein